MGPRGSLGLEDDDHGPVLRALGLWLDPIRPTPLSFVSHAHCAPWPQAGRALASPETIALIRAQASEPAPPGGEPLDWGSGVELPIERAFGGGTARLTTARAGHMLGAAQLIIDHPGGRFVYTGDWSGEREGTHEAGEIVPCDELALTSTFALPIFRFDPIAVTLAAVVDWCARRLAEGEQPVVLAQTPGPAQSIARAIAARSLAVVADEPVLRACLAYEALGVPIGPVRALPEEDQLAVVVAPANARAMELRRRDRAAVAYVSGWALLDSAVEQKRADAAFSMADHADCDALVALVGATGARHILVGRGDARPFARILRAKGFDAESLEGPSIDDRGAS
jgi:hypothetical protein